MKNIFDCRRVLSLKNTNVNLKFENLKFENLKFEFEFELHF